jgi:hypothetical protein
MPYLRTGWNEDELLNLPSGEQDYFERKSGRLLEDSANFQDKMAKELSAFANSGGGHIVLGQNDDGSLDGLPSHQGRTPIAEWIEQKVKNFVAFPLERYRVHAVMPKVTGSIIPADRVVLVIDVGDSRLAPHQACFPKDKPNYYWRQGSHSEPASHYYLEALRNRMTATVLRAQLVSARPIGCRKLSEDFAILRVMLTFVVKNEGRISVYDWLVVSETVPLEPSLSDCIIPSTQYPEFGLPFVPNMAVHLVILPTQSSEFRAEFGFRIDRRRPPFQITFQQHLFKLHCRYHAVSENYIDESKCDILESVIASNSFWSEASGIFKDANFTQS